MFIQTLDSYKRAMLLSMWQMAYACLPLLGLSSHKMEDVTTCSFVPETKESNGTFLHMGVKSFPNSSYHYTCTSLVLGLGSLWSKRGMCVPEPMRYQANKTGAPLLYSLFLSLLSRRQQLSSQLFLIFKVLKIYIKEIGDGIDDGHTKHKIVTPETAVQSAPRPVV